MALTIEDKQEMENYLAGIGIHADTAETTPEATDKVLVIHQDGTGGYITFEDFQTAIAVERMGLSIVNGAINVTYEE